MIYKHYIMFQRFVGILFYVVCSCGTTAMLHTQKSDVYLGKPDRDIRIKIPKQPMVVWAQHMSVEHSNATLISAMVDLILDLNHLNKLDKESVRDVLIYISSQLLNIDIIREQIAHRNYGDLDYEIYRILKEILILYNPQEIQQLEKEDALIADYFLSDIKQGDEIMKKRWRQSYTDSFISGNKVGKQKNNLNLYTLDDNLLEEITAKIYNYITKHPQLRDNCDIETLMMNLSADCYLQQCWDSGSVYSPAMQFFFHQYMKEKEDYELYIALLNRAVIDTDDRYIIILDPKHPPKKIKSFNDLFLHWKEFCRNKENNF